MEKIDLSVIKCRCECGKMACEVDWSNDTLIDMLFNKFGSLDDYTFFICECGEAISMHYTGYDCLVEEYDYLRGISSNSDVQMLYDYSTWKINTDRYHIDKYNLDKLLVGFDKFHFIDSYENYTYYRKELEFLRVTNNPIHKTYSCHKFVADEDKVIKLLSHFGGVKK